MVERNLNALLEWLERPTLVLNPHLQVPFSGEQSPEFHAWQAGALVAINAAREAYGLPPYED